LVWGLVAADMCNCGLAEFGTTADLTMGRIALIGP
jgi:hypothetical protein